MLNVCKEEPFNSIENETKSQCSGSKLLITDPDPHPTVENQEFGVVNLK